MDMLTVTRPKRRKQCWIERAVRGAWRRCISSICPCCREWRRSRGDGKKLAELLDEIYADEMPGKATFRFGGDHGPFGVLNYNDEPEPPYDIMQRRRDITRRKPK